MHLSAEVRARATADRGTTVVEMIVASMLLGVGVLAVLVSLNAATKTTATANNRSNGVNVATAELETIRSRPYGDAGISATSRGFRHRFEGRDTVTSGAAQVEALDEVAIHGITYSIRRHVTWAPIVAGSTRIDEGYKVVTIIVTWDDRAGSHEVREDTGLYEPNDV